MNTMGSTNQERGRIHSSQSAEKFGRLRFHVRFGENTANKPGNWRIAPTVPSWPFRDRLYPPEPQSTVIVHCTTEHQILGLAILPSTETNSTFAVTQKRGDYCNQEAHVDVRFNEPTGNHISISRSPLRPKLSMQRSSFRLYLSTTCSTVEMPTF